MVRGRKLDDPLERGGRIICLRERPTQEGEEHECDGLGRLCGFRPKCQTDNESDQRDRDRSPDDRRGQAEPSASGV